MWKPFAALVFALALVPSAPSPRVRAAEDLAPAVARIAAGALEAGARGLSIAVAFGDELVVAEGWGKAGDGQAAEADSSYHVGALTEAFLACVALQMVAAGELSLDDRLSRLLPELGAPDEGTAQAEEAGGALDDEGIGGAGITLAHLLSHTSGLPSYEDFLPSRGAGALDPLEAARRLAGLPLDFEPGTCQQFSDTNALLLGAILERKSALRVPELLSARIFERAGMESTLYRTDAAIHEVAYDVHEFGGRELEHASRPHPFDADRLCSSAPDLLRWMRSLVEHELIDDESFEQLVTAPAVERGGSAGRGHGLDATALEDEPCTSAGGGSVGYRAHVAHYPGLDLTIVVLALGDQAPVQTLARRIARAAFDFAEPGVQDLPFGERESKPYVGEYMVGCNLYLVAYAGGRLQLQTPDARTVPLAYQGRHAFLARGDPTLALAFQVDDDVAQSFTLVENGVESFGRRMR